MFVDMMAAPMLGEELSWKLIPAGFLAVSGLALVTYAKYKEQKAPQV